MPPGITVLYGLAMSMHLGLPDNDYNTIHPHIRVQREALISGVYLNSEDRLSSYVGMQYVYSTRYNIYLETGLVTGYTGVSWPATLYTRLGKQLSKHKSLFVAPGVYVSSNTEVDIGIVVGIEVLLGNN